MSWRDIMGAAATAPASYSHNSHNSQKSEPAPVAATAEAICANSANIATRVPADDAVPPAVPLALPDELEERAALASSLAGPIPEEWRRGFASLQTMAPPEGMVRGRWHEIINDAGRFLDAWGPQAAALGWMAADVFGINPDAPDVNNSNAGLAVTMQGRPVVAITAETATIQVRQAVRQTYRRHRRPGAVLLWELEP